MSEKDIPERVHYYQGQLLTADDFTTEQEYFIHKERFHNRYLHGWGVVSGLGISVDQDSVFVEPGIAIDCAGNQIVSTEKVKIQPITGARKFYLLIEFAESESHPVPLPPSSGNLGEEGSEFTRIQESFHIYADQIDPSADHHATGPRTPGCGLPHPFPIAILRKSRPGWRLHRRLNRHHYSFLRCLRLR